MEPHLDKGRKDTILTIFYFDSFYHAVREKKTSLVGTLNKIQKKIPPLINALQKDRYSSQLLQTKSDNNQATNVTVYQCKQKKERLYS